MDGSQNKETENKEIKIILEAETSSQNIFAPIVFYQSFDFGKDAPCLSEVYDSIVWKSSHSPNSFKVFSHSKLCQICGNNIFQMGTCLLFTRHIQDLSARLQKQ